MSWPWSLLAGISWMLTQAGGGSLMSSGAVVLYYVEA